jgi:hypothetical protein
MVAIGAGLIPFASLPVLAARDKFIVCCVGPRAQILV